MFKKQYNSLKNKKGLTLVEIMLAIGIIVILALLIVPSVNFVKDRAKTSGVDTNMRMVSAQVQSTIDRYASTDADLLESELVQAFQDDNLTNPFTKQTGVKEFSTLSTNNGAAVIYDTTENTGESAVKSKWEVTTPNANLAGSIVVAAYPSSTNSNSLEVALYQFDKKGVVILSKKLVLKA